MTLRSPLLLAALGLLTLLAACDNDKDIDPPAELVEKLQPKLQVKQLWSVGMGGKKLEHLRLGLRPASDGKRVYAASHDGSIRAFDPSTGRQQWRLQTKLPLSGGVGVGGGRVIAGSSEGDLIAVDSDKGVKQWQIRIRGEVLAAPTVGDSVVVLRTVDGRIHGLDAKDGHELWSNEQAVPRLSLRGNAPPVVIGDRVIAGFDNGKVLALGLQTGEVQWETAVAPAKGRTELERMIDIDSAVRVSDKDVYVVGFQGRVAMLALDSGQIWWAHDASSHRGLELGDENLYLSTSEGDVVALKRRDGSPVWEQKILHKRGLTAPAVDGDAIVVADFEGYVHWLDAATGEIMARQKTDGKRVSNAPLAAGGKVYVMTDNGKLSAFQRGVKLAVSEAGRKAEAESAREAEEKRQKKVEKAMKANKPKAKKEEQPEGY